MCMKLHIHVNNYTALPPEVQRSPTSMSAAPTPVGGAEDDSDPVSQVSTRKWVFDVLSQSLSQTGQKKKHKKYPYLYPIESINIAHTYRDDILLPYVRMGRWIPRAFSPFLNITSMFWIGMSASDQEETENAFISQLFVWICMCLPKLTRSLHSVLPKSGIISRKSTTAFWIWFRDFATKCPILEWILRPLTMSLMWCVFTFFL